jgi:hypothetical protein
VEVFKVIEESAEIDKIDDVGVRTKRWKNLSKKSKKLQKTMFKKNAFKEFIKDVFDKI